MTSKAGDGGTPENGPVPPDNGQWVPAAGESVPTRPGGTPPADAGVPGAPHDGGAGAPRTPTDGGAGVPGAPTDGGAAADTKRFDMAAPEQPTDVTPSDGGPDVNAAPEPADAVRTDAKPGTDGADGPPKDADTSAEASDGSKRRNRWMTGAGLLVALVVIAAFGYFGGLGPLNVLSTKRGLTPPDTLGALPRITDQETRNQLQLDATREALSKSNKGSKTAVEVYGDPAEDGLFVVIALRGKIDIEQTLKDGGARPEQISKVGEATCAPLSEVATCIRGSNTLTVMVRDSGANVGVDKVGSLTNEAFNAF